MASAGPGPREETVLPEPPGTVILTAEQLAEIVAHCHREAPCEACGLVSGLDGRATRIWATRNALASQTEYLIDPQDQFAAMRAIRAASEELLAIYHSHPGTPAYPSPRDVARAYYPEVAYVIVSLSPRTEVKAFAIREGRVNPVKIEIRLGGAVDGGDHFKQQKT